MCVCQVPCYNASRLKRQFLEMKGKQEGLSPRQNAELRWNAVRWNLSWCCPEAWICTRCFSSALPISTPSGGVWPGGLPHSSVAWEYFVRLCVCVCALCNSAVSQKQNVWALGDTQGHRVQICCVSVCVQSYAGTLCIVFSLNLPQCLQHMHILMVTFWIWFHIAA